VSRVYYPLGGGYEMSEGERMALDCIDEWDEDDEDQAEFERLDHIDGPIGVWNATSGPIKMKDMTDAHLANALAWLARYDLSDTEKAMELRTEQANRAFAGTSWPPPLGSLKARP
jgi:hypothetical protein